MRDEREEEGQRSRGKAVKNRSIYSDQGKFAWEAGGVSLPVAQRTGGLMYPARPVVKAG